MPNKKKYFYTKNRKDWKNLLELEENLSKLKKYYGYDDIEWKGIRDLEN